MKFFEAASYRSFFTGGVVLDGFILDGQLVTPIWMFVHSGVASRNGNNSTLRILSCLPQRPEPAVLDLFALAPNVVTGQVDVLPAQR